MLYSHYPQNCIFLYFLEAKNPCFVTKNFSKSSYICFIYFVQTTAQMILQLVGRRKLPDPSLNRIFYTLLINVEYTLSLQ